MYVPTCIAASRSNCVALHFVIKKNVAKETLIKLSKFLLQNTSSRYRIKQIDIIKTLFTVARVDFLVRCQYTWVMVIIP